MKRRGRRPRVPSVARVGYLSVTFHCLTAESFVLEAALPRATEPHR